MSQETMYSFRMDNNGGDPGAGILYAIRYTNEVLRDHQKIVAAVLTDLIGYSDDSGPKKKLSNPESRSARLLSEELSCVNEALEYSDVGFQCNTILELCDFYTRAVFLSTQKKDYVAVQYIASVAIPEVVMDIMVSHQMNDVLTREDENEILELGVYAHEIVEKANHSPSTKYSNN